MRFIRLGILSVLWLPCSGNTGLQPPKAGDVTPTQAIIRVNTDQTGFCTYRVSEGTSFSAPVNDVNPSLFPGSDSDARSGSSTSGTGHIFVAGTRTATMASNGKRYSRALRANTLHWVGVTCGSDGEVSATFQTTNLNLGNNAPELMPFDTTAFGNVGVPSIDWGNKSTSYVDPTWGTSLHRFTGPEDTGFLTPNQPFTTAFSAGGKWTNSANALSAGASSLATCDTGAGCTTSDALFLSLAIAGNLTNFRPNGGWQTDVSFVDFLVRVWGRGTDSTPANRTVGVCWTIDSQTCYTATQYIILPLSAAFAGTIPQSWSVQSPWNGVAASTLTNIGVASGTATVNLGAPHGLAAGQTICVNGIRNQSVATGVGGNGLNGCHTISTVPTASTLTFTTNAAAGTYTDSELTVSPSYPQAQWASWGVAPPHNSVGMRTGGTIGAVNGAVTLAGSGAAVSNFNTAWTPGTKIFIAGSGSVCSSNLCTIAAVSDASHLTVAENLTISNANWSNADFGLLVMKLTGTGSVSLSSAYDMVFAATYNSGLDGSGDVCNSNYVTVNTDADGNAIAPIQGYLCTAPATGVSQATTPIYLFLPSTGETRLIARNYQASANDYGQWVGWHPTDGASWFIRKNANYYKTTYTGDYRKHTPGFVQNTIEPGPPEQLTFSDVFAGSSIATQLANCKANGVCDQDINTAVFGSAPQPPATGAAVKGNFMVLCGSGGAQDSPGYVTYWNMSSVPASLSWAGYTWDKFPVGYGGIHACLNFGNGQFNQFGLNAQLGQVAGTQMTGPWQATPTMVDVTGNGFVPTTAIQPADGFFCPAGLDARWQSLGAKPQNQGGLPLCLKLKIPGEPCSVHASALESANFPCPWNSASNFSMLKAVAEGDTIHDAAYGYVSFGEFMLVVKKQVNSTNDVDLTVFRYRLAPASNFNCGSGSGAEMTHVNGWTLHMAPFWACAGIGAWSNALDSTHQWFAENPQISGVHSDFGEGSTNYTYVGGANLLGYQMRPNSPMPQQVGTPPTVSVSGNPANGSAQIPDVYLQSYPSKRQQRALTQPAEMDWALDVRHYNPSFGNSPEAVEGLFGNTSTLVAGTTNTYLVSFPFNQTPDPKHVGFVGWAGWHQLADKSGPSSHLGDSDLWRYCYAYLAGECVSGSAAGQMYASVPAQQAGSPCLVNSYAYNAICISNHYPYGFWVTQFDTTRSDPAGARIRRLTSAFVAPGRQYNFTNAKTTPDGKWAVVQADWLEGQRTDLFWLKLPPFPGATSHPGNAPGNSPARIHLNGVVGDMVRVAFGYAENGNPSSFYCTTRAEACYTTAAPTSANPFVYAGETQSYAACSGGCVVDIPAVGGRILYYQVERKNGSNVATGGITAVAVP